MPHTIRKILSKLLEFVIQIDEFIFELRYTFPEIEFNF